MGTPVPVKEHTWSPITYDFNNVQLSDSDDFMNDEENENKEIMESIKSAEKTMGKKMGTPVPVKEHAWSPITYDFNNVQLSDSDDFMNEEDNENKEIMESLKSAEKQMGKQMKTPTPVKEHAWSPITYEFNNVQLNSTVGANKTMKASQEKTTTTPVVWNMLNKAIQKKQMQASKETQSLVYSNSTTNTTFSKKGDDKQKAELELLAQQQAESQMEDVN
jgi:hypothetical protein